MHLEVNAQAFLDQKLTRFYTFAPGMPSSLAVGAGNEEAAINAGVVVFQPMQNAVLRPEHNQMNFYTWGDTNCCLPRGATEATLLGSFPNLQPGDVLIFEEVLGPQTGNLADADIRHRCAVRLTQVTTQNSQGQPLVDPLFATGTGDTIISASAGPAPVTEIQWSSEDALPFPVCISSSFIDSTGKEQTLTNVSVVLGNNVLADHGLSLSAVSLGVVPEPSIFLPPDPTHAGLQPACKQPRWPARSLPPRSARQPDHPGRAAAAGRRAGYPRYRAARHRGLRQPAGCERLSRPQPSGCRSRGPGRSISVCSLSPMPPTPPTSISRWFYNPAGGAIGVPAARRARRASSISRPTTTDPNYAVTQINSFSKFLHVPASLHAPRRPQPAFPQTPSMLPNPGPIDLVDLGGSSDLTVQAANPLAWPPCFGVLAQGNQQQPDEFNLLVVYNPSSGGVGVRFAGAGRAVQQRYAAERCRHVCHRIRPHHGSQLFRRTEPQPLRMRPHALRRQPGAVPEITLSGSIEGNTTIWTPKPDLLESGVADTNFVVEVEYDGTARLRFGDNTNGLFPASGARLYRRPIASATAPRATSAPRAWSFWPPMTPASWPAPTHCRPPAGSIRKPPTRYAAERWSRS